MNNVSEIMQCANCGACYNICPADAIYADTEGLFYRVKVDAEKCISCGKCVRVCPMYRSEPYQRLLSGCYAAHVAEKVVKASSSGGAFTAFAEWILSQGGVVYGACYSEDRKQVMFCSTDKVSLDELRRSKYVESQVGLVFRDVKAQLEKGRKVLLCGTPCQVAGLIQFLGREYENLYACDFSCGGLPSHEIYQHYLQGLEQRYHAAVTDVNFRPKTLGWETYAIRVRFANGRIYESPAVLDPYFSAFLEKHYSVRDCCLDCPFADNHYADIVLADFWKYRELTGKTNQKGVSLILVNSLKGKQLMEAAAGNLVCWELNLEQASYNMKRKKRSQAFWNQRQRFLEDFETEGLAGAKKNLNMPMGIRKLIIKLKSAAKRILWGVK